MSAFIPISIYILLSVFVCLSVNNNSIIDGKSNEDNPIQKKNIWVVISSILFALYSKYIIGIKSSLGGDRLNYFIDFNGRKTGYVFFDRYLAVFKSFTDDFSLVLCATTFFSCLLLFLAISKSKYLNRHSISFLLMSGYITLTFTGLKQCMANGFACLFFVLCIEKNKKITNILCWILAIFAMNFHSTGYILIPLYFLLKINMKESKKAKRIFIILVVILLFFEPILSLVARLVSSIFPILSNKIYLYLSDDMEYSRNTVLKGIPYCFLTIFGLMNRNEGRKNFQYYDKYLILTALGGMMYLASLFSYWYSRFAAFFFLPMAITYAMLLSIQKKKFSNGIIKLTVLGSLIFFTFRSVILTYVNYGGY